MKNTIYLIRTFLTALFAGVFGMVLFAQVNVNFNWTAGSFASEPGYEVYNVATNTVYVCRASGTGGLNQTVSIPYGTYEVRGFDSFGDGWNGGSLTVVYAGQNVFTTSGPPSYGYLPGNNTCSGVPSPVNGQSSAILGQFTIAPITCQIFCPADVVVDNDQGVCGANVTVGLPSTSQCVGLNTVFAENFNGCAQPAGWTLTTSTGSYTTPGVCGTNLFSFQCTNTSSFFGTANPNFSGCIAIIDDDAVSAFIGTATITSPLINLSAGGANMSFDYSVYPSSSTITVEGWNGATWVNLHTFPTYTTGQGTLTLDLSAFSNADFRFRVVHNDNGSWNYGIGFDNVVVNAQGGVAPVVINDFNQTANASGFYPIGTTVVTWEVVDASGYVITCEMNVTVNNTQAIELTCPGDMAFILDPGLCEAYPSWDTPIAFSCNKFGGGDLATVTTTNVGGNGNSPGGMVWFDVNNNTTLDMAVEQMSANISNATVINIYMKPGSYVGFNTNPGAWTLVYSANANTGPFSGPFPGNGTLTPFDVEFNIPPGSWGMALHTVSASSNYTNGNGTNQFYSDGNLDITLGYTANAAWASGFTPRVWNGSISYAQGTFTTEATQITGLPSGTGFPIGVTTVTYTATDSEGNTATCSFDVTVENYPNPISNLACNDNVQISVDDNCEALVTADMILEGGPYSCYDDYRVEIFTQMPAVTWNAVGNVSNPVGPGNYVVGIYDETGNNCWSTITVLDKLPPVMECRDVTVTCEEGAESVTEPAPEVVGYQEIIYAGLNDVVEVNEFTYEFDYSYLPAGTPAEDVNLRLLLTGHTFLPDLIVKLTAPDGTTANVMTIGGCTGQDWPIDAWFDDDGATITQCVDLNCGGCALAPLQAGVSTPSLLTGFEGVDASGIWTISISDNAGGDDGIIQTVGLAVLVNLPQVVPYDACGNLTLTYTDVVQNFFCQSITQVVKRTWTATDAAGNSTSCVQTINVLLPPLTNLTWPVNYDGLVNLGNYPMLECNATYALDVYGNPHPNYTGWPNGGYDNCGTLEMFYKDRVFPLACGTKILRDWTVVDDCTGQILSHTQIIRITDSTPPQICGPEGILTQAPIVISTNAWSCTGDYIVPKPVICDNCDPNPTYTVTSSAGTALYIAATKTWIVFGLPEGTHTITYIVTDWCGNTASYSFYVQVVDAIPPMAACEQYKQVSLTFDGVNSVAKVWAQSFDSGSHDHGCGPVWFKVWRNDNGCMEFNCDNQACTAQWFDDYVVYCCDDALVMTTLRVFDVNPGPGPINPNRMLPGGDLYGHFNDCMTTVDVQEKVPPVMICQDITITCEDNIHPDHTGYPTAFATCGTALFSYTDDLSGLNMCNIGVIVRTWEVLKADGSSYSPKITCKQRITVIETLPFDPLTIVFPYISQESCLKDEPLGGKPEWTTNPCNIVDASIIKIDTFRFVDGACYKILREWAVVDWCVYKPNTGAEWNLDEFRYISNNRRAILDPAKFTAADRDGYYRFTEVIMIYDNTAANIHVEDACIGIATCVTAPEFHKFTATSSEEDEDCGGEYEWTYVVHSVCCNDVIQFSSNNNAYKGANYQGGVSGRSSADKLKGANAEFLLLPSLAVGEYRITWTLSDGCGNVTTEYQYITVADKKAPTPFLVDISTATMTNCMVEVTARFFDKGACNDQCLASYDNCSDVLYFTFTPVLPKIDPTWTLDAYGLYYFNATTGAKSNRAQYLTGNAHSWDPVKNTAGRVFTGPSRQVNVDVYVWDKFALNDICDDGNFDFATILLTINSIDDDCDGPVFPLVGNITRIQDGAGINNVNVEAKKDGESKYTTTSNGAYSVSVPEGLNVVTPSKKDDYTNGVTTLDLVLIQKHLLGLGGLNANQLVAADANANGAVTGADIKQLRDLILGVSTSLPSNDSWVFAPRSSEINMTAASTLNFSGIKVGDINADANVNFDGTTVSTRHANVINMVVNEAAVEAGNEIEVAFTAENFNNVRGTQMTLNLNGLNFASVTAGEMNVTTENFGLVRDGIVTMSWNNANGVSVADGAVLFTLKLNANVNGNLSNLMSAGSQITAAEAYTTDALNVNGLNVTFRGTEEVVFELYQNEPNPFAERTVVGFNLPEAGEYTLNVYDVTGRVLRTVNSNGVKGYNKVELNSNDLSAGVLYYQLDSNNFTATKKMIVIK